MSIYPQVAIMGAQDLNWKKEIWSLPISQKVKLFLWKAILGALCLLERISWLGTLTLTLKTPIVNNRNPWRTYFFHCTYAQKVWSFALFEQQVISTSLTDIVSSMRTGKGMKSLPPTGVGSSLLFPWICWNIWKTRKQLIFNKRVFSPEDTISKSIRDTIEWNSAQTTPSNQPEKSNRFSSTPLQIRADTITYTSDAAWRQETGEAGIGRIFKNPLLSFRKTGSATRSVT